MVSLRKSSFQTLEKYQLFSKYPKTVQRPCKKCQEFAFGAWDIACPSGNAPAAEPFWWIGVFANSRLLQCL